MIGMIPDLPYELIGEITVAIVALLIGLALLVLALFAFFAVWHRFWTKVINLCWRGYDPTVPGEAPPMRRRRISIIALGMKKLKHPSDIHEAIKEAHRRADAENDDNND